MNKSVVLWEDVVNEVMPKFNAIAERTRQVLWKAESQFAIQALQKNKSLAECAPYTVQNAVINVAAVGLTLNPADGYAYLVPEYVKDTNQKECFLRISFKGLIKVATDSGSIQWVKADVVKQEDTFEYKGFTTMPEHIMNPFAERGATIGAYCVAKTHEGEYLVDVISASELMQIQSCAKTQNVWKQWPDEMAKKAIIKRASKQWPKTKKSETLNKAVEIINETEGSDEAYMVYTPEQKEHFDDLFEKRDALAFYGFTEDLDGLVYGALLKSSKDDVREEKGATQRGKDIRELIEKGRSEYILGRENILDLAEDEDIDAVAEQFNILDQVGLKRHAWNSFSIEEQAKITDLQNKE